MSKRIREIGENFKNIDFFKGTVLFDEPLCNHTTMKVGGKARVFALPEDEKSCISLIKICKINKIPYFILGGGSNLIFSDDGFNGLILSTEKMDSISCELSGTPRSYSISELKDVKQISDVMVKCGSGRTMKNVLISCEEKGLQTLPTFAGLPGTCGGASFMNARCYSSDVSEFIQSIQYIDLKKISRFTKADSTKLIKTYFYNVKDWSYKHSPFTNKNCLITSVTFKAIALDPECIKNNTTTSAEITKYLHDGNEEYVEDRKKKGHYKAPSAGSVFKNNHDFGEPSGKIIDEAGLKGTVIGGAQIAPWHGNFIINNGNAKAKDIEDLVNLAKKTVKEKKGFDLECEIIFVK